MPQHAVADSTPRRAADLARAVLAWHDRRPQASFADARGWVWTCLVAMTFFWMSNPVLFIPSFYLALGQALIWSKVVVALNLPWLRLPRVPWPWLLFLATCLLSQLWTINPFHTDVSDTVYVQLTVLAVVVAANCTVEVVCWGLSAGGAVVLALSLHAFALEMPGSWYDAIDGLGLAGVGTNRNILAYTLTVSLAATLALGWPRTAGRRVSWLVLLAVHAYGLYRAGSGTGWLTGLVLVVIAVSALAWPRLVAARRHVALVWLLGVVALGVAALLAVAVVLGKQLSTLSGRAPFWQATWDVTMDTAPLLGSGWGAVWEHPWDPTPPNDVSLRIYAEAGYPLPHGHNFFVDVLPELGLVGLALAVLMVAYAVRAVRRCGVRRGADPLAGRLVLLVLAALLVSGMTEPMLTVPLGWWSLVLVVAATRQRVLAPRTRAAGAAGAARATSATSAAGISPAAWRSTPGARRRPRGG